jgi:hypothetical protein
MRKRANGISIADQHGGYSVDCIGLGRFGLTLPFPLNATLIL